MLPQAVYENIVREGGVKRAVWEDAELASPHN